MADTLGAIAQLAYTADELDMLLPLVARVPVGVLTAPIVSLGSDSEPQTMATLFSQMAERDEWMAAALRRGDTLTADRVGEAMREVSAVEAPVAHQVERAAGARRALVDLLRERDGEIDESILFGLVHSDASVLRAIAYALHGAPVTGGLQSPVAGADTSSEGTHGG